MKADMAVDHQYPTLEKELKESLQGEISFGNDYRALYALSLIHI